MVREHPRQTLLLIVCIYSVSEQQWIRLCYWILRTSRQPSDMFLVLEEDEGLGFSDGWLADLVDSKLWG